MSDNPVFLVLDGHNIAYRSFFAIRGLTTRDGRPSNALFGFVKAWRSLQNSVRPTHGCVVFDGGPPTERLARFPEYKAQRPAMPEELRGQFAAIEEFLGLSGVPIFREPAQEADDVIATLAGAAARDGAAVRIASNDKDLSALVGPRIRLIVPAGRAVGVEGTEIGPEDVHARCGVPPERVLEWLALTGDASDNVPGVPGIGPKTAARLLADYGSLAGLWERLTEVTPDRIRQKLADSRLLVERNVELMRLRTDLPLARGWRDCALAAAAPSALRAFYARWDFDSLIRELAEPRLF